MRRAGLQGVTGRPRFRRGLRPEATATDLVNRQFARAGRNQLWVTDITEHPTREGKLYCAVVLDACSRRVVGWSIDATPTAALVTNALGMAIQSRKPTAGTLVHSDQGVQFTSWAFSQRAKDSGLVPSMGRVGDCFDKVLASHCTSWGWLGASSVGEGAAHAFDQPWVAGGGWLVEPFVLVVGLVGDEQAGVVPVLDGGQVHAEPLGELAGGEHAGGAEPVTVAGELVGAAEFEHDPAGEGLAFTGAVAGLVEQGGGLGVGMAVQEPVEQGEGVGVGLAGLPRLGWDRDRQAGGGTAAEADVQVDLVGLDQGDVVEQQPGDALAFLLGGGGIGPHGGEVAGEGADAGLVLVGQGGVRCGAGPLVVVLGGIEGAEGIVPVGLQRVGDQPVVGVDGQVAAAGELGVVAGAFDLGAAQLVGLVGAGFQLGLDGERDLQRQGVTVSSSSWPTAASMPAPGIVWQVRPLAWIASARQA